MGPASKDHQVKARFIAALEQLLSERPLEKISVTNLAEISGLSRRAFYNHFKDINDLVAYKHELGSEAIKSLCPQWFDSPTALALSFVYLNENRAFYRQAFKYRGQNSLHQTFVDETTRELISHFDEGELDREKVLALQILGNSVVFLAERFVTVDTGMTPQDMASLVLKCIPACLSKYVGKMNGSQE